MRSWAQAQGCSWIPQNGGKKSSSVTPQRCGTGARGMLSLTSLFPAHLPSQILSCTSCDRTPPWKREEGVLVPKGYPCASRELHKISTQLPRGPAWQHGHRHVALEKQLPQAEARSSSFPRCYGPTAFNREPAVPFPQRRPGWSPAEQTPKHIWVQTNPSPQMTHAGCTSFSLDLPRLLENRLAQGKLDA